MTDRRWRRDDEEVKGNKPRTEEMRAGIKGKERINERLCWGLPSPYLPTGVSLKLHKDRSLLPSLLSSNLTHPDLGPPFSLVTFPLRSTFFRSFELEIMESFWVVFLLVPCTRGKEKSFPSVCTDTTHGSCPGEDHGFHMLSAPPCSPLHLPLPETEVLWRWEKGWFYSLPSRTLYSS